MKTPSTMNIAFSINDAYAQHFCVTGASLLTNYRGNALLHFYIIGLGLNDENREKIEKLKSIRPFTVEYINVNPDDFKDCPQNASYITVETYFRIKLPSLLPHLDKIMYLDSDTVVTGDVSEFAALTLTPADWVAGVCDLGVDDNFKETIGMKRSSFYFNAGVIMMNLAALRENGFEEKCFDFVRKNPEKLIHVDQDVLNAVCEGHVKTLPPRYNLLHGYLEKPTKKKFPHMPYDTATVADSCTRPIVIHYTGPTKPWFYKCKHPRAGLYMKFLKLTSWADYKYPDKTVFNVVKKALSRIKKAVMRGF